MQLLDPASIRFLHHERARMLNVPQTGINLVSSPENSLMSDSPSRGPGVDLNSTPMDLTRKKPAPELL